MNSKSIMIVLFIILLTIGAVIVAFIATPSQNNNTSKNEDNGEEILYFYSDSCSWCQKQKPILQELENEGVKFKYMNVGEDRTLIEKYNITGTPSFIFKGQTLSGYKSKAELKELWNKNNT